MRAPPTLTMTLVGPALRAAKTLGIDEASVFARAGVRRPSRAEKDPRLPIDDAYALWRAAAALSKEPTFGLHAARATSPGDMGLLEYVVRASPTLDDVFAIFERFHRLLHDVGRLVAHEDAGVLYVEVLAPPHQTPPPPFAEWALASWAGMMRQGFGMLTLHEVWFAHPRTGPIRPYEAAFGCEVRFDTGRNALLTHPSVLEHENPSADAKLVDVLAESAMERVRALPDTDDIVERVRAEVCASLAQGDPSMIRVARALHTSERTLRRRLAEEGTTFATIVDALRRRIVLDAFEEPDMDVERAALRAGFSDGTALHRAFRRWTGETPGAYRRSKAQAALSRTS